MRSIVFAMLVGIGVLMACIGASMLLVQPPQEHVQLHNAYWPYSVETVIRDK